MPSPSFWGWGGESRGKRSIILSSKHVLPTKRIAQRVSSVLTVWKDTSNSVFSFDSYIRKTGGYRECPGRCSHAGYRPNAVSHLGEPEKESSTAWHRTSLCCQQFRGAFWPFISASEVHCFPLFFSLIRFAFHLSDGKASGDERALLSQGEPQSAKNSKIWQTVPHRLVKHALGIFTLRLSRPEQRCQNSVSTENFKTYWKKT